MWVSPDAVGTAGNFGFPAGAPFLWRNGGKSTRGRAPGPRGGKSFFPPHPFSLDCCRSGVSFLSAYLACGLKDQRLMARPPARAGGRSGSLTGGKSGKRNGFSPPFPKGYLSTSPARPAGGRAATGLSLGGPQARYPVRGTASPTQLHQRRESRGKNLFPLGFFPPFLPKKWGPGRVGQGSLPFQRRGSWNNLLPQQKKHLLAKK